jgi:hypothetical protein
MKTIPSGISFLLLLIPSLLNAQKPSEFLPEKPGKWTYSSNIKGPGAEVAAFNKNLAVLAEWFHQKTPILTNPKGFDLDAMAFSIWDDDYKKNSCNYGMRSEMYFDFQLFFSKGGKWVVEPPHYTFYINNTEGGHGTNPNYKNFSEEEYNPSGLKKFSLTQQKVINDAVVKMNGVFVVFPFEKELVPGVKLFGDGNLIVFNTERPDFWKPVTVREMADMFLEYYTQLKDEFMLPYLKKEIEGISEDEMNAPAFSGHDERTILRINDKADGLQFMRFNPEYWDRSLPTSAIQFMTFGYRQMTDDQMDESFRNNGHPIYSQLLVNQINWGELQKLVKQQK